MNDYCKEHDETYDPECGQCRNDVVNSALRAGIPLSVINGETKLSDHFSQEYIDQQCGRDSE